MYRPLGWMVLAMLAAPAAVAQGVPLSNPAPGTAAFAGANFWNINWQGQRDYFRTGASFAAGADPWKPALVEELRPYRVLRFMDWNDTNAKATRQSSFGTRKPQAGAQDQPVAYEWQIDLCNRADTDCWLNLHHTSTAADWEQLAELFRTRLKPSLRLYVEWSNEVWNSGGPQRGYADGEARRLQLPGANPAASYLVYSSVRMFEAFEKVFAGEPRRLVKVLAGQAAWTGPCEAQREALNDARINPRRTRPDVYAIAPYISGKSVAELRQHIARSAGWVAASARCARSIGVPLISYEGGSDSFALRAECVKVQHDPAMRGLYREYLEAMTGAGLRGPFMQYTHSGACWGLKEKTGDAVAQSPKYAGLLDWLATLPRN